MFDNLRLAPHAPPEVDAKVVVPLLVSLSGPRQGERPLTAFVPTNVRPPAFVQPCHVVVQQGLVQEAPWAQRALERPLVVWQVEANHVIAQILF